MDSKIQIFELRNNNLLLETTDYLSGFIVKNSIRYLGLSNGNNASGMFYVRGYAMAVRWGVPNDKLTCGPEIKADCPTHFPCCSSQGFTDENRLTHNELPISICSYQPWSNRPVEVNP